MVQYHIQIPANDQLDCSICYNYDLIAFLLLIIKGVFILTVTFLGAVSFANSILLTPLAVKLLLPSLSLEGKKKELWPSGL